MKDKKYYIALDDFERRVVVKCSRATEVVNNEVIYI